MTYAELDSFTREVMKSPHYAGHVSQWAQAGAYTPRLAPISHMTSVKDTIITCTTCRGERDIAQKHHNGHITWEVCPNCRGTGLMSNKVLAQGDAYKV